jgi:UDP-glucose 4-epimerase
LTPTLAWVVGRGGLLGSRIERLLPGEIPDVTGWVPAPARFSWSEPARLEPELGEAVRAYGRAVRERQAAWMVLWCAGSGGVGTAPDALARESDALVTLLSHLSTDLARGRDPSPGLLLLCSSAGGVYGNSVDLPITEDSACSPISEYGRNKLRQEAHVLRWAETSGVSCLVARISNLYGPGQRFTRSQGLIGHLSQNLVYRRPLNIYVPLDTLRDYLYVEDAARYIVRCLDRLRQSSVRTSVVKIIAAEQSVSIAQIIGVLSRVAKRPPRIVCMPHAMNRQQPDRLCFRSRVWADLAPPALDLAAGVRAVHDRHLALFRQGELPPPRTA